MDLYRRVAFKSELKPGAFSYNCNTHTDTPKGSLRFRSDMEAAEINSYIANYCNTLSYINND